MMEVIELESSDFDEETIIEYKSQVSECWGRTWEFLEKNRISAYIVLGLSALCCTTTFFTLALYGVLLICSSFD